MSACRGKEKKFKYQTELESAVLTYPGRIKDLKHGVLDKLYDKSDQSRILQFTSCN